MHPILTETAQLFNLTAADLTGPGRQRHINEARQAAAYALRQRTPLTLAAIGVEIGGRDHSTVLWAITAAERRAVGDIGYALNLAVLAQGGTL
jgi:chromosomal replication initiator protein